VDIEIVINRTGIYGGVKRLYNIASYLQHDGHNIVINMDDGKKNSWFQHSIPENIGIRPQIRICAETCRRLSPNAINILYQQAQFDAPESDEGFDLVVSTTQYLTQFLLNNSDIIANYQVPYGFDSSLFKPNSKNRGYCTHCGKDRTRVGHAQSCKASQRLLTIAYMPRKNKEELDLILRLIGSSDRYVWKPIDGMAETEVISTLQASDVFLALSKEEGFGCPPFEASLCGCLIIGYHGRGGKEWLTDKTCVLTKSPQEFPVRLEEAAKGEHEDKRASLQTLIKNHLTVEKECAAWLNVIQHAKQLYSWKFVGGNT